MDGGNGWRVDDEIERGQMPQLNIEWLVSADDHVVEPPNLWVDRVPSKLRDKAPHLVKENGQEYWWFDGKPRPARGLEVTAGKRFEEYSPIPLTYEEMRPGCYDPAARIKDMDEGGILASITFPSFPRFAGQVFSEIADRELGFACIQAWNDWMIDEWCAYAPGRFIPMVMIPFWDTRLATSEIERCAGKGARCITFSENPAPLGWPSFHDPNRYWDPVFAACAETNLVINMHGGSSSSLPKTSEDMPFMQALVWGMMTLPPGTCLDFIFSGIFLRHPKLKICLSEGGIGWMPTLLERCERVYDRHRFWASKYNVQHDGRQGTVEELDTIVDSFEGRRPVDLFKEHIYGCFFEDYSGVREMRHLDLLDNIVIETDYPHSDTTWPHSIEIAHRQLEGLTQEQADKILIGNACKLYRFEPIPPARLSATHSAA